MHGFASQSGGSVRIASSVGNGTVVELWLLHANGEVIEAGETEAPFLQPALGRATILVCDDDSDVLGVVAPILCDSGYTVWEAERPSEALEIVERNQSIDLLLVDYAMPEMSGAVVIDRARTRRPDLKALLMSGHADILYMNGALGVPLLSKPFKAYQLRQRVAEVLSARTFDHELPDAEATLLAISK